MQTFLHRRDLYTKAKALLDQPREVIIQQHTCVTVPYEQQPVTSTPTAPVARTDSNQSPDSNLICVEPFVGLYQQNPAVLNASSLDDIFR